jgi:hypothetical protein
MDCHSLAPASPKAAGGASEFGTVGSTKVKVGFLGVFGIFVFSSRECFYPILAK